MGNLIYLMDLILYQILKVILKIPERKHSGKIDNPTIRTYISKTENMTTLKKTTAETMNLCGSTKKKINKSKNGENVPHLEITELVLVHCNIVNNDYQLDSRVLYTFVPNKSFGHLLNFSLQSFIFLRTFNSEFFLYWSLAYWSKFWSARSRRCNKLYFSY